MRRGVHIAVALGVFALSAQARAWDPFLVENDDVQAGNERMAAGDAAGALTQYDRAARALPSEAGVHLNRGLALMESGDLDRAREAFLLATEPPASTDVRADAYYDLGLAFYRQGDAAATEQNHEEAQRLFREAADAFRQSLRIRPGNADAGWNLELAMRRIREQEQEQQQDEQEQQEQDQQNQDQQNQDQQNQDQQNQDQQNQDQQNQDQQNQDQQNQDQQNRDQQNQDQQNQDQQSQDQQSQDQQSQDEPGGDESSDDSDPSQDPGSQEGEDGSESEGDAEPSEPPPGGTRDGLPPEHRRVLDALEQGEENLERHRARARAAQERRRVEQDW